MKKASKQVLTPNCFGAFFDNMGKCLAFPILQIENLWNFSDKKRKEELKLWHR